MKRKKYNVKPAILLNNKASKTILGGGIAMRL